MIKYITIAYKTWDQIHLYLKVLKYFLSICIRCFGIKSFVFVVNYFLKVFYIFKYFYRYVVSINISFSRSRVMPAKLITFTATLPNNANY